MRKEPSLCEIALTALVFHTAGKSVYKSFANQLPLNGDETVLDFGCGMGTVATYAAGRLPGGSLVCVDVSRRWLSACQRTLRKQPNVSFWQGDMEYFPLPSAYFDLIYCHFVLHDIPANDLVPIVPALTRRLKDGGQLIFREPLQEAHKMRWINGLMQESGLCRQQSIITDIPLMGNVLENRYYKEHLSFNRKGEPHDD